MLLETLFCTVFFVLPLVGMFALVIRAALRREAEDQLAMRSKRQLCRIGRRGRLDLSRFKKRHSIYPVHKFENKRVLYYQLVECRIQHPLQFGLLKRRANPRAGP